MMINIKEYVRKFLNPDNVPQPEIETGPSAEEAKNQSSNLAEGIASLEGMSSATARFIIERKVPENFAELWDVTDIANRGRYFIAKVVAPDGKLIDELLVDKQNGAVHFLRGRFASR